MALNIKDPETHRLAQQLAERTGESMTRAVTTALRERLARLPRTQKPAVKAAELLEIGRRCAANLKHAVDHGALLYDGDGLPK